MKFAHAYQPSAQRKETMMETWDILARAAVECVRGARVPHVREDAMTKGDALVTIIKDARSKGPGSRTSYQRILRALKALECTPDETLRVAGFLDYIGSDGQLFQRYREEQ